MCGWQVKLCDPLVTHGSYLSALEITSLYIKCCINSAVYFTLQSSSDLKYESHVITKTNFVGQVPRVIAPLFYSQNRFFWENL